MPRLRPLACPRLTLQREEEKQATPPVAAMMGSTGLQEADTDVDTDVDQEEEPCADVDTEVDQ